MFWQLLSGISQCTPEQLEQHRAGLPLHFLEMAFHLNRELDGHASGFEPARQRLTLAASRVHHANDPEIYFSVFSLIDRANDAAQVARWHQRLSWGLGLLPLESIPQLADGYYRLRVPRPALFEVRGGQPFRSGLDVCRQVNGTRATVWLPHDGLFNDILDVEIYPRDTRPREPEWVVQRLQQALAAVREWSPALAADFDACVRSIVILPDWPDPFIPEDRLRWSYNLRFRYFGGIFLNPFRTDEFGLAEGLIHEYLHQRLWQWWELEQPSGLPAIEQVIVSPLTGATKPACVMLQALLIYLAAAAFYESALERGLPGAAASGSFVRRRAERLRVAVPLLHERLREHVIAGTTMYRVVERALDLHASRDGLRLESAASDASSSTAGVRAAPSLRPALER